MEPRIQYVKTSDGVNIAYWTLGDGPPLVMMPFVPVWSHVQIEWQVPELRRWYQSLASGVTLVRYDGRGFGLSDHKVSDLSLDAMMRDLDAVIDRLETEKVALWGQDNFGRVAAKYAARQPERVSHLILWNTSASGPPAPERLRPARALADTDWEMFTETWAHTAFGWSAGGLARRFAELRRESTSAETTLAMWSEFDDSDVSGLLPEIRVPALVLGNRNNSKVVEALTRLASSIPDAQLTILEQRESVPFLGEVDSVLRVIGAFLGAKGLTLEAAQPGAFRTILFTDVEGSTALTNRLGDAKARDLLRDHERMVREALKAHGGSEVKTMGDGFMASFTSATKALECSIALQQAFAEHNESTDEPINVRVGINAGEPIEEDGDMFGATVILASRIAAKAEGGEILVADTVRGLCSGKGFLFSDRGEFVAKGFEDAVRVSEVSWRE